MNDFVAFCLGWVVSYAFCGALFLYTEWESLYPSWVILGWDAILLTAFFCAIPALVFMVLYTVIRNL